MDVGQKAEEAKLTNTAKGDPVTLNTLKPFLRLEVMNMPIGSECYPNVDIRQEGHRN